ncbi:MAG TPA: C39 family peptidase [Atribacteraceae bacterium]|nr:C39 family peptidase [Atribacteraceae bacterium]
MRHTTLSLLVLTGFLLAGVLSGCSTTGFDYAGAGFGLTPSTTPTQPDIRFLERSDTNVQLAVPFLSQVPPGSWAGTRNCGPASAAMLRAYYYGEIPTSSDIIRANHWLNVNHGTSLNNGNGDFTNVFMIRGWLVSEGVEARVGMGNLDLLRNILTAGNPVLVAVYSDMNPTGGAKHAMVVTGLNETHVTVNDPGKVNGANNTYSISRFLSAWRAQGNWYLTLR